MTRIVALLLMFCSMATAQDKFVTVSERQLPIAYEVDVLVVGGSTGDVAAAIEAQKAGAKTMLITERPYLGDDMTATLRLWLEPGEKLDDPLAAAIYNDPNRGQPSQPILAILGAPKKIGFSYSVEQSIDKKHAETDRKNRLSDGKAADAVTESLQINGDATIILDLKKSQKIGVVSMLGFFRKSDYEIESVTVSSSDDEKDWKSVGVAKRNGDKPNGSEVPDQFCLALDTPVETRYLKLDVKKTEPSSRVLLGEIVLLADKSMIPVAQAWTPKENEKYTHPAPRPMHVKQTLDKALEDAGVKFLYSTYEVGTLLDKDRKVRGAVINNRAGKQVILAKEVCRLSFEMTDKDRPSTGVVPNPGKELAPFVAEYIAIGGEPKEIDALKFPLLKNASYEIMGEPFYGAWPNQAKTKSGVFPIIRYAFTLDDETGLKCIQNDLKTINELENQIRLATYDPDQQFTSDKVSVESTKKRFYSPAQAIVQGRKTGTSIAMFLKVKKDADSKASLDQLTLCYPGARIEGGEKVPGDVKESLNNVKAYKKTLGFVKQAEQKIPVVAEYDVVVVGGGTTGAPAGISAARQGAKTLVLEYLHDLGGLGTAGAISIYYWGNRVGFCKEVEDGKSQWVIEQRTQWWRSKLAEAGADVWYGVLGTGAIVDPSPTEGFSREARVKGVIIATPNGPKAVLGKVIIDATGNGDIAEAAGAKMQYVDGTEIAVQGHGLPPRNLGASYTNTDYMYVDETDMEDITHLFVYGKEKFPKAFDFGKIIDSRERKRVVGDFSFTALDQVNKRTYPDTICRSRSNFDTHGYTVTPYLEIEHLHHDGHFCDIPMRSCLPQGLEGIFVGGLATSCHRDAIPIIRMQPDLQNQGYALGCLAAKAAKDGVPLRKLDIKPVQQHLVDIGNLPETVLTDKDNYGDSIKDLPDAIKTIPDNFKGSALLLWHPKESLPLIKEAYQKADSSQNKLAYAMLLAGMGDPTGADALLDAAKAFESWDKGWNFRGMGQFGWASSQLDRYFMMLGRTKDKRAVPVICNMMKQLKAEDDFSHHRACALALEWIGDKSAAPAIAEVLKKPGVAGYVHHDLDTARKWDQADPKGGTAEKSRRDSLIEIGYARTLYRLGDYEGVGKKILDDYSTDLRGYFSRHANEVLKAR